jgi:hypothetical protein
MKWNISAEAAASIYQPGPALSIQKENLPKGRANRFHTGNHRAGCHSNQFSNFFNAGFSK